MAPRPRGAAGAPPGTHPAVEVPVARALSAAARASRDRVRPAGRGGGAEAAVPCAVPAVPAVPVGLCGRTPRRQRPASCASCSGVLSASATSWRSRREVRELCHQPRRATAGELVVCQVMESWVRWVGRCLLGPAPPPSPAGHLCRQHVGAALPSPAQATRLGGGLTWQAAGSCRAASPPGTAPGSSGSFEKNSECVSPGV